MIVAIDFDDTYTADPKCFDTLIHCLRAFRHKVIIATYRHEELDAHPWLQKLQLDGVDCHFTDGKAKQKFLLDKGIVVDIWIDDNPRAILEDSAWKPDSIDLEEWRKEQEEKIAAMERWRKPSEAKLEDTTLKIKA